MIDLHGHYLPGFDDGAENIETALAMLRHARADGIETVAVTPHAFSALNKDKKLAGLRRSWQTWGPELRRCMGEVGIVRGAEIYFTSELLPILKENRDILTINNGSYFLLEFPGDYVYAHSRDSIFKFLTEGFIPIISHAERNQEIQRSPSILRDLVDAGALCQVNAGSLRGDFGNQAQKCAFELIRCNLVHVIASDAHDLAKRRPELAFVAALLHHVHPEKIAMYLHDIPAAIIANQAIPDIGEPLAHQHKRAFFDFFKKRES